MTNYIIDENGYYVEVTDDNNLYLGEYQDREFIRTEMTIKVFEEDNVEIEVE